VNLLDNNLALKGKTTGGSYVNIVFVTSGNRVQIGSSSSDVQITAATAVFINGIFTMQSSARPGTQQFGAVTANGALNQLFFNVNTTALTCETAVVTNGAVGATSSAVLVNQYSYSGTFFTNGIPNISVSNIIAGSYTLRLCNLHATNSLSGVLKLAGVVFN